MSGNGNGKRAHGSGGTPKKPGAALEPFEHSDGTKAKALKKFRELGIVNRACEAANISRTTWYRWLQEDQAFAELVHEATEAVTDSLEEVAHTRAIDESDTMLIFLLKARRRAIYGDRQQITMVHPDITQRVQAQATLIASRKTWDANELLDRLSEVWK